MKSSRRLACIEKAEKRMTTKAKIVECSPKPPKTHINFKNHTLNLHERKLDHHGKTSRHDKKDRQKETETSKEEETETTEAVRLQLIAQFFSALCEHLKNKR